jgi:hypothetical protein
VYGLEPFLLAPINAVNAHIVHRNLITLAAVLETFTALFAHELSLPQNTSIAFVRQRNKGIVRGMNNLPLLARVSVKQKIGKQK